MGGVGSLGCCFVSGTCIQHPGPLVWRVSRFFISAPLLFQFGTPVHLRNLVRLDVDNIAYDPAGGGTALPQQHYQAFRQLL